eukprot:SAG31_NODE_27654_length_422_cov_1.120743_2_plen_69_part_01
MSASQAGGAPIIVQKSRLSAATITVDFVVAAHEAPSSRRDTFLERKLEVFNPVPRRDPRIEGPATPCPV